MSKIEIECPKCGKHITIDIVTIDKLKQEITELKAEIARLKTTSDPLSGLFDWNVLKK